MQTRVRISKLCSGLQDFHKTVCFLATITEIRIQLRQFDLAIFRVDVSYNQGLSPREIALQH